MNKVVELKANKELAELKKILEGGDISTVFQPIVSLKDGSVIGYECLSRGPVNSELYSPDRLFEAAEKYHRLWDLELLCRVKAIERAQSIEKNKYLFINVDPHILKDEKFKKGFTKEFLAKHNMSPESIIFEITEKTSIEDYKTFKAALKNYVEQGYKIAIDDMGSGYSGLKMLSETKPHFVKIDMELIRDIDRDSFKQALIKCFVSLAEVTNMKLIAEGIETEEELLTLIDLGVYAGQGYFLQKPAGTFLEMSENITNIITKYNRLNQNKFNVDSKNYIGQLARKDKPFAYNTTCGEIKQYFERNTITGACVVKDEYPIGLIMNSSLDSALATQYGVAVFSRRSVSLVMDKNPLVVDFYSSVSEVSKAAMARSNENLYDSIIVTKDNKYYGVITIRNLLDYTTKLEYNYAKELNPLTGLPGNTIIESNLNMLISSGDECCLLYLDLDNFKVYNDNYGFENGDKILKFTGDLIKKKVKEISPLDSFVGHIGGDDFICILRDPLDQCKQFCQSLIDEFDDKILEFFNEQDKLKGFIEAADRKGNIDKFGLTSISIAGIFKSLAEYKGVESIAQKMSSIKKEAKKVKGSSFCIKC